MNHKSVNNKDLKLYAKLLNVNNKYDIQAGKKQEDRKVPLSTKDAVKYLLQGTLRLRVCRYCLNVTNKLTEFEEVLTLAVGGSLHEVTIRDIVASFHPYKVTEDPNFPNKICSECVNQAISCYLFTQQCDRAERALRNCFDDINEKFEKLDSIEPVKKRGKRKLNPNTNLICVEHKDVMNYAEPVINIVNVTNDTGLQSNDEISNLECQKCWQVLPTVELLLNHENSHPKSMWFNCRLCGKSFVKRSHLKKHIKITHAYGKETTSETPIQQFRCNECGTHSKTVGEHLQHNEKHKFKGLLKNLIERKVDKLCSVCHNKSAQLTDLGEIVYLHGGYPELTGDKSIKNILTATIPGPNAYKYQELLVPHKAKIVKLIKRKHNQKEKDVAQVIKESHVMKKFVFASPTLVESGVFKLTNTIVFPCSKPHLNNPIQDSNEQKDQECNINEENTDECQNLNNSSKEISTVEEQIDTTNQFELIQVTNCKTCWLFKTPFCKTCSNLKNETTINSKDVKSDCKFCWIFEKTGGCPFCKKSVDCNTNDSTNIADAKVNINETDVKLSRKIYKIDEQNISWQCSICLTTNSKNRLSCICCDEEYNRKDITQTKFGNGKAFYSDIKKYVTSNSNNEIDTPKIIKTTEMGITDENTGTLEVNIITNMEIIANNTENNIISIPLTEIKDTVNNDSQMEVEMNDDIMEVQHALNISTIEDMDIGFDNAQTNFATVFPIIQPAGQNTCIITNPDDIQSKFLFNLGTGGPNDHNRRRKALRRMATTSHK